jgi:hypothetical protein
VLAHTLQERNTLMSSTKYIGMDVHTESISIAVRNSVGKLVMECVIETKASTILQFIDGLRGDLRVTFEEGTWHSWSGQSSGLLFQKRWVPSQQRNGTTGRKNYFSASQAETTTLRPEEDHSLPRLG